MINQKSNWKIGFFTIWSGQAISQITSAVLQFAIVWYLTAKTNSAFILSIATLVGFLPQAIFGPFIGVLIDRYNRKAIMTISDLVIAFAGLSLVVVSSFIELPVWLIMLVLFIRSVGTAFHSPSLSAVTPLLVPEDKLTKCAGYSQTLQAVSYIVSPALAAFLYGIWNLNAVIAIDVIVAVLASVTVLVIKIPKVTKMEQTEKMSFKSELQEGISILRRNKGLFNLLWIGALYMMFYMPINALFPLMSMSYFGGTTFHASVVEIAFAVGMFGGGAVLSVWGGTKNKMISIILSIALMGASLVMSGLLPKTGFIFFTVLSVLMGISVPFYSGLQMALFQEKIEAQYLGRVFSLSGSAMMIAMPIGLLISSILADRVGVHIWFLLSGVFVVIVALLSFSMSSVRNCDKYNN